MIGTRKLACCDLVTYAAYTLKICAFSDTLMEECVRAMQQSLRETVPVKKRVKSVYNQRNLGTIKERKKEKNQEKETSSGEIILRILRMRSVLA